MFEVNIAPDMGMYSLLRSQGYDPAYALGEFIDNALHAYLTQCADRQGETLPLKVDIKFYSSEFRGKADLKNCILIEDDGPGIGGGHLAEALKPAKHTGAQGLSEFGIGMKAAAVWFADTWSLSTWPMSESKRYSLTFDLASLLRAGQDVIEVEEVEDHVSPKGTLLTLNGLRRAIDIEKFKEICLVLRELYQRFTEGDLPRMILTAHFNDSPMPLKYSAPPDRAVLHAPIYKTVAKVLYAIGPEKAWQIPVATVFNGHKVEGFICLLETGSYKTNPGIILFRRERVIAGTTKQPFSPQKLLGTSNKYARQRVFGELHMDEMPVTYTKDKFEFDENAFVEHLKSDPGLIDLLHQAEEYRSSKKDGEPIVVTTEGEIYAKPRAPTGTADPTAPPGGDSKPASGKDTTSPAPADGKGSSTTSTSAPAPTPAPKPSPPVPPDFVVLLTAIKESTSSLMLRSLIAETVFQYQFRREVSTAMCFRMVLEMGVLFRIERDFPDQYLRVSEKGIKAVINYMNGNLDSFFDAKRDHRVSKCVQSIASGAQADVVLLNNTSHGHYQPSRAELNRFAINIEQLLRWAYEPPA